MFGAAELGGTRRVPGLEALTEFFGRPKNIPLPVSERSADGGSIQLEFFASEKRPRWFRVGAMFGAAELGGTRRVPGLEALTELFGGPKNIYLVCLMRSAVGAGGCP